MSSSTNIYGISAASVTGLPNTEGGGISPEVLARVSRTLQQSNTQAPKINAALTNDKAKLSGLGQLQSAIGSFQDVLKSLSGDGLQISANSSAAKVLSATSSAKATSGTFSVQVNQLAQSQVLQSKTVTDKDATLASDVTSQVKIELGSLNTNSFVANAAVKAKNIVISPSNSSLSGIATAINDANIGVTAKVVQSGKNFSLSLTTPTGTENTLRISVTGDSTVQKLLNYNPTGAKNLVEATAAQNAQIKVNGKDVVSQSNTISNALEGTTFKLLSKGNSEVVIKQDSQQVSKNINNLVSAFNAFNGKVRGLAQNELKNERSPGAVLDQFSRSLRNASVIATDGTSLNLEKIGIRAQRNGDLAIDDAKLQAAIVADPTAVAKLFTDSSSGLTENLNSQAKSLTSSGGTIGREVNNVTKDIASLTKKKESLTRALTIQANALVRQYSQQNSSLPGFSDGNKTGSIFDFLA